MSNNEFGWLGGVSGSWGFDGRGESSNRIGGWKRYMHRSSLVDNKEVDFPDW